MKIKLMLLAACLTALTGCAALGKVFTPANAPLVSAGIDLAVGFAVGTDPLTQKVKALAIKTIAQQIAVDAADPTATVATIEASLNAKIIKLAPNPLDAAAFMTLATSLQLFLNQKVQAAANGVLTPATLIDIQQLANDVVTATSFFGV